ncbi:FecR family protein [Cohnella caldifontis]|uniref:FecR family protein n=1 Tax=Cohnella caldifontis TaxID=3027471 RepID=UPI0023EA9389|nr:FecR family protein [Cohnella sp. YIM B05605]
MRLRRSLVHFLAFLLFALPLLGAFGHSAYAASSRVAIIKSLTGNVQVKKAGGSKPFKAFAKMSLNEGDVLTTSANSTAVLQFSNGTSEDDKLSVSANTTLTFSKLSDRGGTRTKVSMFNGSAWVDVKSISTKNDEFTLETPTAIMGVRGTHLLVSVDPDSGVTRVTVAAGVVHTEPTGEGEAKDVKPGDNALVTKNESDQGEVTIAPADLDLLLQHTDKSIVEAIVAAAGEIVKENRAKLDQYFEEASENANDQARKKSNVENLLGAIVDSALKSGKISQDRVNQLVAEAQAQTGVTIDLSKKSLTLTDEEKQKQQEQKKKEEDASKAAKEQKKKEEEQRNKELLKKLEDEKKKREEANQQTADAKKKKATDSYKNQLSDEEKKRFENDQKQNEQTNSPSPVGSSGGSGGTGDSEDPGDPGDPGNPPPASSVKPSFLSDWSTVSNGKAISWSQIPLYGEETDALLPTFEFYKADIDESVQDIEMTLNFSADSKVYLISPLSFLPYRQSEPSLLSTEIASESSDPAKELPGLTVSDLKNAARQMMMQFRAQNEKQRINVNSLSSETSLTLPPLFGPPVAYWKASGLKDTLPVTFNGSNYYYMFKIPNGSYDFEDMGVALLWVQKASLPFQLKLNDLDQGYYNVAQTGSHSFIAGIGNTASGELYLHGYRNDDYDIYNDVFDWSVAADNKVSVNPDGEYEKGYLLSWDPLSDHDPATHVQIQTTVKGNPDKIFDKYTFTIVKGDTSALRLSNIEIKNGTRLLEEFNTSESDYGYLYLEDPNINSISLFPEASSGHNLSDLNFSVYRNGSSVSPDNVPVGYDENVYDIVIRPKNGDPSSPVVVYKLNVFKDYPTPALTSLKVNGGNSSILEEGQYHYELEDTSSSTVTLSLTGNNAPGKWMVVDEEDSIFNVAERTSANDFKLNLKQGHNAFLIYNTITDLFSESSYDQVYSISVYREPDPASLDNVTLNFNSPDDYYPSSYDFDPDQATYEIQIKGTDGEPLPVSVSLNYRLFSVNGYTRTVSVSGSSVSEDIPNYHGYSSPISLPEGTTTVKVKVTATKDGDGTVTSKTYTFNFTREKSQNVDLSFLRYQTVTDIVYGDSHDLPIDGTLMLNAHEDSLLVTSEALDLHSKVAFNEETPLNPNVSQSIPLTTGTNTLNVTVVSESGRKQTYKITIVNPDLPQID